MTVRVPLRPLDTGGSFGNRDVIVYGSYGGGGARRRSAVRH